MARYSDYRSYSRSRSLSPRGEPRRKRSRRDRSPSRSASPHRRRVSHRRSPRKQRDSHRSEHREHGRQKYERESRFEKSYRRERSRERNRIEEREKSYRPERGAEDSSRKDEGLKRRPEHGRNGGTSSRDHHRSDRKSTDASRPVKESNEQKLEPEAGPSVPSSKGMQQGVFGGVYIPPFRLAQMMKECNDKSSQNYQRLTWDALRKSLNGIVNKVNGANMRSILPEIFSENLIRGRGLFCRAMMKSQMASPSFTPVYAALVAVVNTKFPEIGELLLKRVILQFKRGFRRNDKHVCIAATQFLAHLMNQGVAHELLLLELLMLLLENPSNDGVDIAVSVTKEVGAALQELSPQGLHSVFERLRAILHEGEIDKRVQFMIEGLFAIRKAGFAKSGFPAIQAELDLVEEEDQITHEITLDEELDPEMHLDVFKSDDAYEQHEQEYEAIKKEILGAESEDEDEEEGGNDEESDEYESGSDDSESNDKMDIHDMTETDVVNLRRTIYLTIMSSLDFEEAGHKLLSIKLNPGQECEITAMIIECCSQERTYLRYYGLLAQRFALMSQTYRLLFEENFTFQYSIIHRLETNKLRNVAKLSAHLLASEAISWSILSSIRLTEEDTTSSARIFIKILFQELSEILGLIKLNQRLQNPEHAEWFEGIFPKDTASNMRFSINFFTSIGLGGLTDKMRELLKELPRIQAEQAAKAQPSSSSSSSSESGSASSSSSSGSGSTSDSDSDSDSSES